jgi:hypothetical protein
MQVRIARQTGHWDEVVAFYRDRVGVTIRDPDVYRAVLVAGAWPD